MPILYASGSRGAICDILPKRAIGAEIGVYRGGFSRTLGTLLDPKKLFLIDPWWTRYGDAYTYRPSRKTKDAYQKTCDRMQWWIERGTVEILVQRSQDALAAMDDALLDWAYVDASHEYAETAEELNLLKRKVKPGGLIAGHDFNTRQHPGVFRAISEFLAANPSYELCYIDDCDQWALRAPGSSCVSVT